MCLGNPRQPLPLPFYLLVTEQSPELILDWAGHQEFCVLSGHWECSASLGSLFTNPIPNVCGCVWFWVRWEGSNGKALETLRVKLDTLFSWLLRCQATLPKPLSGGPSHAILLCNSLPLSKRRQYHSSPFQTSRARAPHSCQHLSLTLLSSLNPDHITGLSLPFLKLADWSSPSFAIWTLKHRH